MLDKASGSAGHHWLGLFRALDGFTSLLCKLFALPSHDVSGWNLLLHGLPKTPVFSIAVSMAIWGYSGHFHEELHDVWQIRSCLHSVFGCATPV
jgi:hypothetical protein